MNFRNSESYFINSKDFIFSDINIFLYIYFPISISLGPVVGVIQLVLIASILVLEKNKTKIRQLIRSRPTLL